MTSRWQAIGNVGSDRRAFQRRVSDDVHPALFDHVKIDEIVRCRLTISTATISVMLKRAAKDL